MNLYLSFYITRYFLYQYLLFIVPKRWRYCDNLLVFDIMDTSHEYNVTFVVTTYNLWHELKNLRFNGHGAKLTFLSKGCYLLWY